MFVRSTGDQVYLRRSADDGATWAGFAGRGRHLHERPLGHVLGCRPVRPRHSTGLGSRGAVVVPRRSTAGVDQPRRRRHRAARGLARRRHPRRVRRLAAGRGDAPALGPAALERLGVRRWPVHLGPVGIRRPRRRPHRRQRARHRRRQLRAGVHPHRGGGLVGPAGRRHVGLVRPCPRRHLARGLPARRRVGLRRAGRRAARLPRDRHHWRRGPLPETSSRARTAAT